MAEVAQTETSEQIAKRIVREMNEALDRIESDSLTTLQTFERVATLTCVAIIKAMAAEREACASIAREVADDDRYECGDGAPEIERRIRARGSK